MSIPHILSAPASPARQRRSGLAITLALLALLALGQKLPWQRLAPIGRLIAAYPLLNALLNAVAVVSFIPFLCLFLIWQERKFAGWMQARLGPMHVGWTGTLQTVADALKLLLKEDILPTHADRPLLILAPYLVFVPTVLTFMVLPFSLAWVGYDYSLAALFVVSISTISVLGILAAGWGSNNKYSLLGGVRAVAQLLSYEIPMILVVLTIVTLANTLSLTQIVQQQAHLWNIVAHPLILLPAFLIYFICALAEVSRSPFDLPEAESELVSGFHTEYSGMRFAFFFLAEFANNFFTAGFAIVLFFGGWLGPALLPAVAWFMLKTLLVICLMMWVRWTLPRLRVDQMMGFCWKLLVPLALLLFCAAALTSVL